jgi:hypothetical protein
VRCGINGDGWRNVAGSGTSNSMVFCTSRLTPVGRRGDTWQSIKQVRHLEQSHACSLFEYSFAVIRTGQWLGRKKLRHRARSAEPLVCSLALSNGTRVIEACSNSSSELDGCHGSRVSDEARRTKRRGRQRMGGYNGGVQHTTRVDGSCSAASSAIDGLLEQKCLRTSSITAMPSCF